MIKPLSSFFVSPMSTTPLLPLSYAPGAPAFTWAYSSFLPSLNNLSPIYYQLLLWIAYWSSASGISHACMYLWGHIQYCRSCQRPDLRRDRNLYARDRKMPLPEIIIAVGKDSLMVLNCLTSVRDLKIVRGQMRSLSDWLWDYRDKILDFLYQKTAGFIAVTSHAHLRMPWLRLVRRTSQLQAISSSAKEVNGKHWDGFSA